MRGGLHNHHLDVDSAREHIGTMVSERTCRKKQTKQAFLASRSPRTVELTGYTRAPFSLLMGGWPKMRMR
jgi:hypothetical protein